MITKAGVSANKILIGMALYGRTFKMTDPACRGPECQFTGPAAGAEPGRCTNTRGYMSNFEIREIQSSGVPIQEWTNQDGDYLIYNNDNWVSWMTKTTYASRLSWVKGLNFGGTADWAIDLDADYGNGNTPGGGDSGSGPVLIDPSIYTTPNPVVRCYPQCTFVFPPMVLPSPTTIVIPPETITFEERWTTTSTVSGAIVTATAARITSTVVTIPPITTTEIEIWNVVWTGSTNPESTFGTIGLTMSVSVPPATFTYSNTIHPTPIVWTYSPGPWPPLQPTSPPSSLPGNSNPTPGPPGPPPPPPPSGFPTSVNVEPGTPGPICKSRCGRSCPRNCDPNGTRCIGICGCLGICPDPPCLGVGCSDSGGGGGGGEGGDPNDPNDSSSSCRTRTTVSTCFVQCSDLQYPNTRTTTCEDPECTGTRTACSATGTTTTSTTTLSCESRVPYPSYDPNQPAARGGDGGLGGIIEPGEFSSMSQRTTSRPSSGASQSGSQPSASQSSPQPSATPSPTPSPSTAPSSTKNIAADPPLPTWEPLSENPLNPYCFKDHGSEYRSASGDVARGTVEALCNTGVLSPDNTYGYASRGADNFLVSVTWAKNQDGCAPKADVPMYDFCIDTFWNGIVAGCDGVNDGPYFGGAFVEKNSVFGCVQWWVGTLPSNSAQLSKRLNPTLDGVVHITDLAEQQALEEFLERMEPDLPMIVRAVHE
jgi:chitinase